MVKCLIANGADVNAATKYGGTPLHSADWRGSVEVLQCLVSHGADVNARDNNGKTPLHDAANNSLEVLQYLASRVEDVNAKDDCGMTPLFIAVACNSLDAVKCLVSRGANVGVKNNTDDTLLHNASHIDRLDVLQYLVSLGLNDVNARNASGETPIFNAVTSRYSLDILEYLVSQGADVNVKTDEGFTPLHEAVMSTDVEVVDYLIFHGADVDAKDNEGKTALDRIVEEATECVGEKEAKGSYAEFSTYERIERLHRATGLTHQDTGTHFLTHYLTVNYHVKIDHYEKMRRLADAGDF
jgi:ankyrin repeat protein